VFRLFLQGVVIGAASLVTMPLALAQDAAADYPSRPVMIVAPFPPGGSTDTMARLLAQELTKSLGQQFLVDNKPGANGNIGSASVARAEPDGYTLLLSGVGSNAINYTLYPKLGYNPKDLTHISLLATGPNVLIANPDFEAKTFKEFIELAKSKPNEFNYASSGIGSSGHLAMEMLKQQAGIDLTHVPYKGGAPAMTDVIGGQVPVMFLNQDVVRPNVEAGKLLALAVTSSERNPSYPDTPTIAKSGYPGFSAVSWFGLSAPAKTPEAIIDKLHAATAKAVQSPEFKDRIVNNGFVVVGNTPEEFTAFVEAEKWGTVIKTANIQAE
jgi:tripartite-type tricarboxylate transporter receptor subunit TctC